jgi:alanine or glycine:cation symporter, AGCS family
LDALKDYKEQKAKGIDPSFNSNTLDVEHTEDWDKIDDAETPLK